LFVNFVKLKETAMNKLTWQERTAALAGLASMGIGYAMYASVPIGAALTTDMIMMSEGVSQTIEIATTAGSTLAVGKLLIGVGILVVLYITGRYVYQIIKTPSPV
jgi:hypothetical protein